MTTISRPDLEALLRRAGVSLQPEQISDVHAGWELLELLLERIRQPHCDFSSEPAPIFRADAYTPVSSNRSGTP